MITTAIATLSISSYLISTALIIRHINQSQMPQHPFYLAWLAVLSHLSYIGIIFLQSNGFSFSFFSTGSLIAMIVALLLLIAVINKPVEKLGIALFPIAALMLGLAVNFSDETRTITQHNWAMSTHILTNTWSMRMPASPFPSSSPCRPASCPDWATLHEPACAVDTSTRTNPTAWVRYDMNCRGSSCSSRK